MNGKLEIGLLYFCTGGLFIIGWIYDCIKLFKKVFFNWRKNNNSSKNIIKEKIDTSSDDIQISSDKKILEETTPETSIKEETVKNKSVTFPFTNGSMFLKYQYDDIEVKGTQHYNFDINEIDCSCVDFEFEPSSQYDENAIKVLNNNVFIGYVPKNNIQKMIKNYIEDDNKSVIAIINKIDLKTKYIQLAVGFYKELSEQELNNLTHFDTKLIKTTKKDEFDNSRQENLLTISENDELDIYYQYDTETYLICDNCSNELGEINTTISEKLHSYELEGNRLYCTVLSIDDNDNNISCKVRIFII